MAEWNQRARETVVRLLRSGAAPLVLMGLAALPRLHNLLAMDPFVDEVAWTHWAVDLFDVRAPHTLWTPLTVEGRPPLYYWLVLLLRDVDQNPFVGSRMASALAGSATAAAIYLLGRSLWTPLVGWIAGLLWALLPFGVFIGRIGSSDDSLVALGTVLTLYASVRMIRQPSLGAGALCGALLGLTILAKTLGALAVCGPILAIVILARRADYRRLRPSVLAMLGTSTLFLSPLLPWAPKILSKSAVHAEIGFYPISGDASLVEAAVQLLQLDRLRSNVEDALEIYRQYLGDAMLAVLILGIVLATTRRDRAVLFLTAVFLVSSCALLDRATHVFSRYLLAVSTPLYLLGAVSCVWLADGVGRITARRFGDRTRDRHVSHALTAGLVLMLLSPMVAGTFAFGANPYTAPWSDADRWDYFDQWYALDGLGELAERLKLEGTAGPISVLLPRNTSTNALQLPHRALRLYLRGEQSIGFVEGRSIARATDEAPYRQWLQADRPTFVVINEAPVEEIRRYRGEPTQLYDWFKAAMPSAVLVHRWPRPAGPYALALYRIDRGYVESRR